MCRTIAFIPARGRSKGIKLKNIKKFCGKPLIYWVLNELTKTKSIDEVIVATDDNQIKDVILNLWFKGVYLYDRLPENAQDKSPTIDVIQEYISRNDHIVFNKDIFMLVQCTNPFATSEDYENGIKLYKDQFSDSVVSCCKFKKFLWNKNGIAQNYDPANRPRRQDIDNGLMLENGAFYISSVERIKNNNNILSGAVSVYEMPEYTGIDIDTEDDLYYAEYLMKKYRLKNE